MAQAKANGITIEYESFGRDGDPVVLLIMGFSAQLTMWPLSFCRQLAATGLRVIRFDNRDVGLSTHLTQLGVPNMQEVMMQRLARRKVEAPYQLDDMAADVVGLLDALGIADAHIVGVSMGGMIAQIVAAKYPARTRSLVSIMSTTGRPDLPQARPEAFAAIMAPPASDTRADRVAAGMKVWRAIGSPLYPATDDELRQMVETAIDHAPYEPTGIARQMVAIMASPARNDILKTVRCPALVLHGADDPLIPVEGGKDTADSIPGAKLVVVPGMAHDFTEALVPIFLENVGGFVSSLEAKSKAA